MAPTNPQARLLTAANSRLGQVPDLAAMLSKENAWIVLPRDVREKIYALLPPPNPEFGDALRDPDINPLLIQRLRPYIDDELRRFQEDLREGREVKKWREEAMMVRHVHVDVRDGVMGLVRCFADFSVCETGG